LPNEFDDDAAGEHHGDEACQFAKPRPVDQLPGRPGLGADPDHQREQHQCDEGAEQGFLQDKGEA
jgi:hypothetical protein